ncbi:APC family permease [Aeromicrobium wangtongii]|uniref:APC family permease n=1 Tax=Aeromicrobium wangtongii TaxID=2969247 RepID=UPI00201749C1|nr:amino acid permease [Aeromicrobium wangtongii]MCL3818336.1 amino acid permease [Aeromicrobium wangtongii]
MSLPASDPELDSAPGRQMGLGQSTALVVGTIIGVGVFSLPYSLAGFGPISLVAMAIGSVAAIAFALLFAALSHRMPADGGLYAYSRTAFGNGVGFANAWSYWIDACAGNAAIAVGWVFYVEHFVNKGGHTGVSILIALACLWIPAALNLTGVRTVGEFQVVTTVLKFIPLLFLATVGLFFVQAGNFTPWNTSGDSSVSAIGGAMAICLFTYLGVETAAVAAARVRDPRRNIPRATVLGTLSAAVVYMLSLTAVFGIVPASSLSLGENKDSYAVAANSILGGSWPGDLVAAAVVISGLGASNGWTMICAEMPRAAADDRLFPSAFIRTNRHGAPFVGILASAVLASVAVVVSFLGTDGATVFTTLVLMTGITAAIPFGFSALAQISWRIRDRRLGITAHFVRDIAVAVVSLAASIAFIYYSRNNGDSWYVVWGPFLMAGIALLLGVPIYLAQRAHMVAPPPVPDHE